MTARCDSRPVTAEAFMARLSFQPPSSCFPSQSRGRAHRARARRWAPLPAGRARWEARLPALSPPTMRFSMRRQSPRSMLAPRRSCSNDTFWLVGEPLQAAQQRRANKGRWVSRKRCMAAWRTHVSAPQGSKAECNDERHASLHEQQQPDSWQAQGGWRSKARSFFPFLCHDSNAHPGKPRPGVAADAVTPACHLTWTFAQWRQCPTARHCARTPNRPPPRFACRQSRS